MTPLHPSRTLLRQTYLRLSPSGRWIRSTQPYNLGRHPAPAPPPRFETLASDATPVPSLQTTPAPEEGEGGTRVAVSSAGAGEVRLPSLAVKEDGKKRFLGVEVPVKPEPPAEGECCMSGCAHCVYDLYLEDLETYHTLLASSRSSIFSLLASRRAQGEPLPAREEWPEELGPPEEAIKEQGEKQGEREEKDPKVVAQKELERTREGLDPTMRAFLEMEARMKQKQKDKAT
ncbi:hypothetical protein JCM10213_001875 [Rhodosporidiobolus nylandii]